MQRIILTRQELYEKVWSIPMSRLAQDYQMSDVGLAKICKKMEVPRPGRGYWAKEQSGAKMPVKKLGKLSKNGKNAVMLYLKEGTLTEMFNSNPAVQAADALSKIEIADNFEAAHHQTLSLLRIIFLFSFFFGL